MTSNMSYTLNNGITVPSIGFGTYQSQGDTVLPDALAAGYRYFDTASIYETERMTGIGIKESDFERDEVQIASKIWLDEMDHNEAQQALERSLERLQLDYLDMYLIHWPKFRMDDPSWKERNLDVWKMMEDMVDAGKIRSIGLSNFLPHHLDVILENCRIKPAVDQLEIHIGYSQEYAVRYCQDNGILPQAWSPLNRAGLLNDPFLNELAASYGKSVPQLFIRFLLDKGIMPIIKSSTPERMTQNLDVYDFCLSDADIKLLSTMPQNAWMGEHPDFAPPQASCNRNQ